MSEEMIMLMMMNDTEYLEEKRQIGIEREYELR